MGAGGKAGGRGEAGGWGGGGGENTAVRREWSLADQLGNSGGEGGRHAGQNAQRVMAVFSDQCSSAGVPGAVRSRKMVATMPLPTIRAMPIQPIGGISSPHSTL